MLKQFGKGLLTVILLIVMGALGIIEIGIEVVYQLVRLIKRGYEYAVNAFLDYIEPMYRGKLKLKFIQKEDKSKSIKIYEFDYETEEP